MLTGAGLANLVGVVFGFVSIALELAVLAVPIELPGLADNLPFVDGLATILYFSIVYNVKISSLTFVICSATCSFT